MLQDSFDRLLSAFGDRIGIAKLAFDDGGYCHLRIDADTPLTLKRDTEAQRLILISALNISLPAHPDVAWLNAILSVALNPLKGEQPGIGLDASSNLLMLYRSLPIAALNLARFEDAFGQFIEYQKGFAHRLPPIPPQDTVARLPMGITSA